MNTESHEDITVLAVDADIIAYRVAAVCEGSHIKILYQSIDAFIENLARESGVHDMVMFLSDKTNFRYEVAKTQPYKEKRKDIIRPFLLAEARDYILSEYDGYIHENMEADDCVASFMTQHDNAAHAGIDKDIKQIHGWHYNFVKKIWEFTSEDDAQLILYRQVCQGDSTDHIPGLPRIGEKKAADAVTDPHLAEIQAIQLYHTILSVEKIEPKRSKKEINEYYQEQKALIKMIDNLEIPYQFITVEPKALFAPDEDDDGFVGFDLAQDSDTLKL